MDDLLNGRPGFNVEEAWNSIGINVPLCTVLIELCNHSVSNTSEYREAQHAADSVYDHLYWASMLPLVIAAIIVNVIAIMSVHRLPSKRPCHIIMISLAMSDMIGSVSTYLKRILISGLVSKPMNDFATNDFNVLWQIVFIMSPVNIVFLALDVVIGIVMPFRHKMLEDDSKVTIFVVLTWIVVAILASVLRATQHHNTETVQVIVTILGIVVLVFITGAYSYTCVTAERMRKRLSSSMGVGGGGCRDSGRLHQRGMVTTAILVCVLYICYIPILYYLFDISCTDDEKCNIDKPMESDGLAAVGGMMPGINGQAADPWLSLPADQQLNASMAPATGETLQDNKSQTHKQENIHLYVTLLFYHLAHIMDPIIYTVRNPSIRRAAKRMLHYDALMAWLCICRKKPKERDYNSTLQTTIGRSSQPNAHLQPNGSACPSAKSSRQLPRATWAAHRSDNGGTTQQATNAVSLVTGSSNHDTNTNNSGTSAPITITSPPPPTEKDSLLTRSAAKSLEDNYNSLHSGHNGDRNKASLEESKNRQIGASLSCVRDSPVAASSTGGKMNRVASLKPHAGGVALTVATRIRKSPSSVERMSDRLSMPGSVHSASHGSLSSNEVARYAPPAEQ